MTASYCTPADVYRLALSAQAFVTRPRAVEAVDVNSATIKVTAHGLDALDVVVLVSTAGGSLPSELSAAATYTPTPVSADILRLAPVGGSAFAFFSTSGAGWSISVDPTRRLEEHILDASARIDQMLLAHACPLQPDPTTGRYPLLIVGVCARMAARSAVASLNFENPAYRAAADRLLAQEGDGATPAPGTDRWLLRSWIEGMPIRPEPIAATPTPTAAARGRGRPAVGWGARRSM